MYCQVVKQYKSTKRHITRDHVVMTTDTCMYAQPNTLSSQLHLGQWSDYDIVCNSSVICVKFGIQLGTVVQLMCGVSGSQQK